MSVIQDYIEKGVIIDISPVFLGSRYQWIAGIRRLKEDDPQLEVVGIYESTTSYGEVLEECIAAADKALNDPTEVLLKIKKEALEYFEYDPIVTRVLNMVINEFRSRWVRN
jgi:hypothetical protein